MSDYNELSGWVLGLCLPPGLNLFWGVSFPREIPQITWTLETNRTLKSNQKAHNIHILLLGESANVIMNICKMLAYFQ